MSPLRFVTLSSIFVTNIWYFKTQSEKFQLVPDSAAQNGDDILPVENQSYGNDIPAENESYANDIPAETKSNDIPADTFAENIHEPSTSKESQK